jgi:hypothetical protein
VTVPISREWTAQLCPQVEGRVTVPLSLAAETLGSAGAMNGLATVNGTTVHYGTWSFAQSVTEDYAD